MWKEQLAREARFAKEDLSLPQSVAIFGIGQVGTLFASKLTAVEGVQVLGKGKEGKPRPQGKERYPGISFSTSTREIISQRPEVLILAVPTFVVESALQEAAEAVAETGVEPPLLVLPQNGVNVVPMAISAFKRIPTDIVRASLLTAVTWDSGGEEIIYRGERPKIALAQVQGQGVDGAASLLRAAGFIVEVCLDYVAMEYTKLLLNTLGTTATVTGLSPGETFQDRDLFTLEFLGLQDRARILKAAGITLLDFKELGMPTGKLGAVVNQIPRQWIIKSPEWLSFRLRQPLARFIADQRGNTPPSSWRRIAAGTPTEVVDYHQPFIDLGQRHGLASPVDEAIVKIVQAHEEGIFDLRDLTTWERRQKLIREVEKSLEHS